MSYLFKLDLLGELERQRGRNLTPISLLLVTESHVYKLDKAKAFRILEYDH